eukprot:17912-Heterococcus_DN1.PRE.2
MESTAESKLPSQAVRLQQFITASLVGFAIRVCSKYAGLDALQGKVEDLQRDNERLMSNAQASKKQHLATQSAHDAVVETDALVKRVMEFVGPDQYLFAASINRSCRQMQLVLGFEWAEGSSSRKAKLRTSFTAALASPARLQWAFSSGLKQKDGRTCSMAAYYNRLDILQWAREQGCPWDMRTCTWAARAGHLHVLQWAREHGCPWGEFTCYNAAWKGHVHVLKWARAHGCTWYREDVLRVAAMHAGVDMLKWLQHNSGEPWSDADKATMLLHAGRRYDVRPAKWLRQLGA